MICYWFWFSIETSEIWFLDLLWGHNLLLFNRLVVSDSLLPHGLQHARLPCPSLSPGVAETHVHWANDAIHSSHPLLPLSLPALNLSQNEGLFHEWALRIRWPKYWSFSFSPSNEYSGLVSFKIDWFDLLAAQGTLDIFKRSWDKSTKWEKQRGTKTRKRKEQRKQSLVAWRFLFF